MNLPLDEIENIEKMTLRWLVQAIIDFGFDAYEIFYYSPDDVKDVAEDVTREILDRLPGYNISQRIFGTVDYKKARYIILPDQIIRQALFVDSKAEKDQRSATLQMSQISMAVRQIRKNQQTDIPGMLPVVYSHNEIEYLTTTLFIHYYYLEQNNRHELKHLTAFCVPNGRLQSRYNPTPQDSFWLAGRNAPSLGEDFRVRVCFKRLKNKANWRVQRISFDPNIRMIVGNWED